MIPATLNARSYRFAFAFSGQPQMDRAKNLDFYDKLTAEGIDFPIFEQHKNEIILQNVGSGVPPNVLRVTIGNFKDKFRLFILEDFPNKTMEIFQQTADKSWKVLSEIWKPPVQALNSAEVTLRYTAAAEGGNATNFLLNNCLKIPKDSLAALERKLQGVGLRLVSPVLVAPDEKLPLSNADFNVVVETLLEDPSLLYIQITSKWPSFPLPTAREAMPGGEKIPTFLNPECKKPSVYLKEAENFVKKQMKNFFLKMK